jgi:pimeloyl-ACP methyl ester carboxylesterase
MIDMSPSTSARARWQTPYRDHPLKLLGRAPERRIHQTFTKSPSGDHHRPESLGMRTFAKRSLILLGAAAVVAFMGLGWWSSHRLLHPPRRDLQDYHREIIRDPRDFGIQITPYTGPGGTPCLMVTPVENPDRARKGRAVRDALADNGIRCAPWGRIRGTVVLLHGYKGRKEDHLPVSERLCAAGFRCLLPDLPGHGDHPSATATFGRTEADQIAGLLRDAAGRFSFPPENAGLLGVSQGGAISLQAAALDDSPWKAVASISAFASLDQPIASGSRTLCSPVAFISPLASTACNLGVYAREGFLPSEISPVAAVSRLGIPVFIAHGEQDSFIPIAQGRAIFDAIPSRQKTFRPVPGAGHGNALAVGSTPLYAELCAFFLKAM